MSKLSVMLNSLACSLTFMSFLTNSRSSELNLELVNFSAYIWNFYKSYFLYFLEMAVFNFISLYCNFATVVSVLKISFLLLILVFCI
jgi:hypothetical protein